MFILRLDGGALRFYADPLTMVKGDGKSLDDATADDRFVAQSSNVNPGQLATGKTNRADVEAISPSKPVSRSASSSWVVWECARVMLSGR